MSDIRFTVAKLLADGWIVLPVKPGEKATRFPKWSNKDLAVTVADFAENDNLARRLDDVVDIDCDCAETRALAAIFLPSTEMIHGRPSLGPSHFWYTAEGEIKSEQFKDTDGQVLVEIRTGRNQYTLIPPSVVMTKTEPSVPETLIFERDRAATTVEVKALREAVLRLATAALLARHWPKGSRHVAAISAAGFLAARGMESRELELVIRHAATLAGDDEVEDRARAARDTARQFAEGGKTAGGPALEQIVGKEVLTILLKWYGGNASIHDGLVTEMNGRHFYTRIGKDTVVATIDDESGDVHFQGERALYSWYANQRVKTGVKNKKVKDEESGDVKTVPEDVRRTKFEIWREHPSRRQYRTVVFSPPPAIASPKDYNLWTGFAVQPIFPPEGHPAREDRSLLREWVDAEVKPKCQMFLDLSRDVVCSGNDDLYNYLIKVLAITVQFPGKPSEVCVVLRGGRGTGKGTFVRGFGSLFGRHFIHLDRTEQLAGKFNAALSGKVVIFADEAFFAGDKRDLGALKRLITEPTLSIERKGIDVVQEDNYVHLFMATNDEHAFHAGEFERRFFSVKVSDKHMQDHAYFNLVNEQMRTEEGRRALLTYLAMVPVTHDEVRAVPRTDELRLQQELSLPPELKWWKERLWDGSFGLNAEIPWPHELSGEILYADYLMWCDSQKVNRRVPKIPLTRDTLAPWLGPRKRSGASGYVRPLPTLAEARRLFDEKFGVVTPWPDDDAPTPEHKPDGKMPF